MSFFHSLISGGQGYSEEAQAVFANMDSQPPTALKNAMAAFVDSQVTAGNWDKIVDFVRLDLDTKANSLKGWKGAITGSFATTLTFEPAWNKYHGVLTTGGNQCINSGFIPNEHAQFALNNCGFMVGVNMNYTTSTSTAYLFGGTQTSLGDRFILYQTGGTSLTGHVNSNNTITHADGMFDNYSSYGLERLSSTQVRIIKNGVAIETSNAVTSGTKSTVPIYIGAGNSNGTIISRIRTSVKYYVAYEAVGFDHAAFYTGIQQLNDDILALHDYIPIVLDIGQSNSEGSAETNRLFALTSYTEKADNTNYYSKNYTAADDGLWQLLQVGTYPGVTGQFGGEASLAQGFALQKDRPIYYIKAARGGSSLGSKTGAINDWDPSTVGECYDIAVNYFFLPALADLQSEYPGVEIKPILLWHQGEEDASDAVRRDAYQTNFTNFMASLRSEHALLAAAPLMITKLYFTQQGGGSEAVINTALENYVSTDANAYIFDVGNSVTYPRKMDLPGDIKAAYPPDSPLGDDAHNSYEFQVKKGEMIYDKLVQIGYI